MNKLLRGIITRTVKITHGDLYKYTIRKIKFGNKYNKYPLTFEPGLIKQMDEMIPEDSEFFCQSVKLLSLEDLRYYNGASKINKVFQKHYQDAHIFAYTECCASVFIEPSSKIYVAYVDNDSITQHHEFDDMQSFLEAACTDKLEDVSCPLKVV